MMFASIFGRAGKDPEMRHTQSGQQLCTFSVAADHGWGEKKTTTWVNVVVFGKRADSIMRHVAKGQRIVVHGEVYEDQWTGNDGQERKTLKCTADQVEIVDWPDDGARASSNTRAPRAAPPAMPDDGLPDDDLPF